MLHMQFRPHLLDWNVFRKNQPLTAQLLAFMVKHADGRSFADAQVQSPRAGSPMCRDVHMMLLRSFFALFAHHIVPARYRLLGQDRLVIESGILHWLSAASSLVLKLKPSDVRCSFYRCRACHLAEKVFFVTFGEFIGGAFTHLEGDRGQQKEAWVLNRMVSMY